MQTSDPGPAAAARARDHTSGRITVMARIHDVVFDSRHPASIARFWAAALDDYEVAPYDQAELDRLRSNGITDPEDDPTVLVEAPGARPRLFFQLVAVSTGGSNFAEHLSGHH